jgi:hypothetical protein
MLPAIHLFICGVHLVYGLLAVAGAEKAHISNKYA